MGFWRGREAAWEQDLAERGHERTALRTQMQCRAEQCVGLVGV